MFSKGAQTALFGSSLLYEDAIHTPLSIVGVLLLVVLLIVWRIWNFSILPALYPLEPKELPYWIPGLGHGLSFLLNFDKAIIHGRKYMRGTNATYKINLAGRITYIVTSPREILSVYKNTATLSFEEFIRPMLMAFGASKGAVEKWIPLLDAEKRITARGITNQTGIKLCHEALLHGKRSESLQSVLLGRIHECVDFDKLSTKTVLSNSPGSKRISLLQLCREVLMDSATHAFFGSRLLEIEPNLFEIYYIFDSTSWKIHTGYPRFLSNEVHESKNKIWAAMTTYLKLPKEGRPGMSWLIENLETEMRKLDIVEKDIAAIMVPMFWVINGNAYKTCFWMLSYILYDPALLAALRAEIDPAVSDLSPGIATRLERCPRLQAVFQETLRLTSSAATTRGVQRPTQLGDKVLSGGATIMIPSRELHVNKAVFGAKPLEFDPDRFLNNKQLAKDPSFKPFGGGSTYCPGRVLAQREVLTFVALALHRLEFEVVRSRDGGELPRFPRFDRQKFCLGTLEPMKGDDLVVDVAPRMLPKKG